MTRWLTPVATLAALLAAGLGASAETVAVPNGCTALATVHKAQCHATTIMDCGDRRQAWTYKNGEPLVLHLFQPDWELIEFRYAGGQVAQMTAVPNTGSNMNLAQARETGNAVEDGEFLFNTNVIKNRRYHLDGRVTFAGETIELNGVTFDKGRIVRVFELEKGKGGIEFELDLYVAQDRDLMFEASWQRSVFGNNVEVFDQTPLAVYFPGETGFLATRPEVGCE